MQVLEPSVCELRLVDSDGSTAGYLYQAMEKAKEAIKNCSKDNQTKYWKIWELLEHQRSANITHPIHVAPAFLNPSYMTRDDFRECHEIKEGINVISFIFVLLISKTSNSII